MCKLYFGFKNLSRQPKKYSNRFLFLFSFFFATMPKKYYENPTRCIQNNSIHFLFARGKKATTEQKYIQIHHIALNPQTIIPFLFILTVATAAAAAAAVCWSDESDYYENFIKLSLFSINLCVRVFSWCVFFFLYSYDEFKWCCFAARM